MKKFTEYLSPGDEKDDKPISLIEKAWLNAKSKKREIEEETEFPIISKPIEPIEQQKTIDEIIETDNGMQIIFSLVSNRPYF